MPMSAIELLLHVQRLPPQGAGLRAALALAERLQARLDAIHVVDMPPAAFTLPEAVPMQLDAARQRSIDARALAEPWQVQLGEHGLQGAWRVAEGDSVQVLCHAAAGYDLLVMERGVMRGDAPVGFGIVSRCVFGSSRPVLVVPEQAVVDSLGERILVAWNGSREAALAIREALPLLRRAGSIIVLDGTDETHPDTCALPIADVCEWLRRHEIHADYRRLDINETKAPGAVLLEAAQEYNVDLLVMGAWSRSRLSEMVLGGTTRHLFMHSDLPMLVAH
jgi:nucleotide-binding universal stress UspA family protein